MPNGAQDSIEHQIQHEAAVHHGDGSQQPWDAMEVSGGKSGQDASWTSVHTALSNRDGEKIVTT